MVHQHGMAVSRSLNVQSIAKHGVARQDICSDEAKVFYHGWSVKYVHKCLYFVLFIGLMSKDNAKMVFGLE